MILKEKIPEQFYKLFRVNNMNYYMDILVALYDENNEVYTSFGLTTEQCRQIVMETMAKNRIEWQPDIADEGEEYEWTVSPSTIVTRLVSWGWLKSDFDDKVNEYVISFPEYSQMYIELFRKLNMDDSERERASMLAVYSALYTYYKDEDKNNDILKNALKTSRGLSQLLSNMQDGMRDYFDELSRRKDFIGIQEVLISELNNSHSKKYAILTTRDSFYRYKEAVRELVGQILMDSDARKREVTVKLANMEESMGDNRRVQDSEDVSKTRKHMRLEKMLEYNKEASTLCYRIEREFNIIERKYNKLIEQKTIFAKRALARIHYILQEGSTVEDNTVRLISLLDKSSDKDGILMELEKRLYFTSQFENITSESMYRRKSSGSQDFEPIEVSQEEARDMMDYIPKPLYTKQELHEFRRRNMKDGKFVANEDTVQSIEDLEKLMFLWNEAINEDSEVKIEFDGEVVKANGMRFSRITIG